MEIESNLSNHRRKHIRVKLSSLYAEVSIDQLCGTSIRSGARRIFLLDLSPYGLRFQSDLHFPVTNKLVVKVSARLVGQIRVELRGRLIWRRKIDNMFEYGMELYITDSQALLLRRYLTEMLREISPHQEIVRMYKIRSSICHHFQEG